MALMAGPCRDPGGKGKANMAESLQRQAISRKTIVTAHRSSDRPLAVIILAAGQGTRMKSSRHKVLHPVAGRPMLLHLLASVGELGPERQVVVVGAGRDQVEAAVAGTGAVIAVQDMQLGTGHAVRQAHDALAGFAGDVLILYGDVPLVQAETMRAMLDRLSRGDEPRAVVLGFRPDDAAAYGRIIADGQGVIEKMVEYKDASEAERAVTLCNSGLMAVRSTDLFVLLDQIGNDNAAGEYYLPDIVMLPGGQSAVIETEAWEVAGVNSRIELAGVEALWQQRRRADAMRDGVTLVAPDTVFFSHDTVLGRDVVVGPNVVFGPGVRVADDVVIHAFSHLEGASVAQGAEVGPYARLRPGAEIGPQAKVGNFVEIKKAVLGEGAKVNHLSYIGDATIGAAANIGAGTITCNYDGFFKSRTEIGAGAFVGSNSALVAPVSIGEGAIVAAGSVVTRPVEADALCLVRPEQLAKPGWAAAFRARMKVKKAAAKA
jgi:bifunctional UDP-N-acetylglucosamine pyrophosphorylase/glucosamine-1-phosphate N-acetyltransferase